MQSSIYFILLDMCVWGWIHQEGASFQNQTTLVNLGLFLAGCSILLAVLILVHAFCHTAFLSYRPWMNFKGKHWYKSLEVSWWPLKKHLHFISWAAFFSEWYVPQGPDSVGGMTPLPSTIEQQVFFISTCKAYANFQLWLPISFCMSYN